MANISNKGFALHFNLQKNTKMALMDYYNKLSDVSPKAAFRRRVMNECDVDRTTVHRWFSDDIIPDKLKREKIAEIAGVKVEELFPTSTSNEVV